MPTFAAGLGMQAASQAASGLIGTGMGLLLEGHNDRRQLRQQEKLQNLEIKGSKELTDYNAAKQLEMWKATNYPAQVEQMKLAGLNPALAYGMGGGGGVTANVATGKTSGIVFLGDFLHIPSSHLFFSLDLFVVVVSADIYFD